MKGQPILKETDQKRKRLPKLSTIRDKCDKLLTPIIKVLFPRCLLCGNETEVAHHHVHKSKSTRLRYHISNLINLCHKCHLKLHHNESYWASKIVEKRGIKWFQEIDKLKNEIVKADVHYYINNYQILSEYYEDAKQGILEL